MQELKCHGSPGKNSSFNLCWSQNTQLCRAGMLAHQGVLEHSPLQSTTATLLESPLVFKSDSLWHFPSEREKAAEKQGNPFQHLSHCSLQKWGHRKKKSGCGFSNLWGKSILQPQAPPQRLFTIFAVHRHKSWQQDFVFWWRSRTCICARHMGSIQAHCSLLAHYLKTPQCCSQFEAAEKAALLWHFMWNNHWNKQLQWHTVVGWR